MTTRVELQDSIEAAEETKLAIDDLIFDQTLYSRTSGVDQAAITDYSHSITDLPTIIVNQDNIIVDGVHRYKAFQKQEQSTMTVRRIQLDREDIKLASILLDLRSGVRHPEKDIKDICRERWSPNYDDKQALWTELGISERTYYEWTEDLTRANKEAVYRQVLADLCTIPELTQAEIAERNGIAQRTISNIKSGILEIIADAAKSAKTDENTVFYDILSDYHDFIEEERILYSIWNAKSGDNNDHFGHFPMKFAKNLLYYHTEPLDIVYDPFAGSGTMLDACRTMFRKCYASDRKPPGHRKDEIAEHDIADGLPEDLPKKIALAFIDPPYWKQAEGTYSEDAEDLGNMSLEAFNESMEKLFTSLTRHKAERIGAVIQPTQYKNDWQWTDHIFDFDKMLPKYRIEARYFLPYSTQQYNAQMVKKAKEMKHALSLHRDLVVWRKA